MTNQRSDLTEYIPAHILVAGMLVFQDMKAQGRNKFYRKLKIFIKVFSIQLQNK